MQTLDSVNSFIEDTCVLVVVAYILTRGRLLAMLLKEKLLPQEQIIVGLLFGLLGATEYLFPHLRYPYVTQTLFVLFAALIGGWPVSGIATVVILIVSLLRGQSVVSFVAFSLGLTLSCLVGTQIRSSNFARRFNPEVTLASGMLTQAGAAGITWGASLLAHASLGQPGLAWSVPANGVALFLLGHVVTEARLRNDAERFRIDAEQAKALAIDFQLAALRSRIHPHFLFNTLTSIAVLCRLAPEKAEQAVMQLSSLMRRALEGNPRRPVPIAEEMAAVEAFVAIEKLRLGDRLCMTSEVSPDIDCDRFRLPGFSLLTLVENAIQHGIARRPGTGTVLLRVQRSRSSKWAYITVGDNGKGIAAEKLRQAVSLSTADGSHGLALLDQQLRLTYGNRARLHLFSKENMGTVIAFRVPMTLS